MNEAQRLLQDTAQTLDALLRVRNDGDNNRATRERIAAEFLSNELRKSRSNFESKRMPQSTPCAVIAAAGELSLAEAEAIRCRCLFYACDDLIALLVHKKVRGDVISREEAVLYVQDRLQRDDFRRIRTFDAGRGAAFVTYMWQVVNNLLLDFLRAQGKRPEVVDDESHLAAASIPSEGAPKSPQDIFEIGDLHAMLKELMTETAGGELSAESLRHPIRERLRPHLQLTSKQKVFLKAMFQYDMTINEVRELPGFAMGVNEAYRFYYRIMEQLLDSFKRAGVLDNLRQELSSAAPRVAVEVEGQMKTIEVTRIHLLEQVDRRATHCLLGWHGKVGTGVIQEGFSKLTTRLAAFFTPLSATEAVADRLLAKVRDWRREGVLTISEIEKSFKVGKRQWVALKARFGANSAS